MDVVWNVTTIYNQQTNYTLGATPLSIPINAGKSPVWVNLANNTIAGQSTGTTVVVQPNGAPPQFQWGYGASLSFQMPPATAWVQVAGNGANVSFQISDTKTEIMSVTVPAPTAAISGTVNTDVGQGTAPSPNVNNTQEAIVSSSGGVSVNQSTSLGTTLTTMYTTPSGKKFHLLRFYLTAAANTTLNVIINIGGAVRGSITNPNTGLSMTLGTAYSYGPSSTDTIIRYADLILLPTDVLSGYVGTGTQTIYWEGYTEQL